MHGCHLLYYLVKRCENLENLYDVCVVAKNTFGAAGLFPATVETGEGHRSGVWMRSNWNFKYGDSPHANRQSCTITLSLYVTVDLRLIVAIAKIS